jgi:hypothetical protein
MLYSNTRFPLWRQKATVDDGALRAVAVNLYRLQGQQAGARQSLMMQKEIQSAVHETKCIHLNLLSGVLGTDT